jgi:hypothetical protein
MAAQRIALERLFAEHHNNFQIFQRIDLLRLYRTGYYVHNMILVSFLIMNCQNCFTHTSSTMFGLAPPSLEEYLPLDEVIPPAPYVDDTQLGLVYDFN